MESKNLDNPEDRDRSLLAGEWVLPPSTAFAQFAHEEAIRRVGYLRYSDYKQFLHGGQSGWKCG